MAALTQHFGWRSVVASALCMACCATANDDIKESMSSLPDRYMSARPELMRQGWQPYPTHRLPDGSAAPCWNEYSSGATCAYMEVEDCSGTGQGFCLMWFRNDAGEFLRLVTVGGAPPDAELIDSWSIEAQAPQITVHEPDAFAHLHEGSESK